MLQRRAASDAHSRLEETKNSTVKLVGEILYKPFPQSELGICMHGRRLFPWGFSDAGCRVVAGLGVFL